MRYRHIFFDLDGTVTEPVQGITNAVIYSLEKFNIKVTDRTSLYKFIGPPLRYSYKEFFGFSDEEAERAVAYYREYYSAHGIVENEIMCGMDEALKKLKDAGCHLYIATSKPEIYAVQILEHLKLADYFDIIAGSLMDGSRDDKKLVIQYLLDRFGAEAEPVKLESVVMVGDRKFDILGAAHFGMDNIGVTFGYGDRAEFEECHAMHIVDSAEELVEYILS